MADSSDDDSDYGFYGTLVDQPDEENFKIKKAPRLEDQIVTDSKGRRRFHGAFTGGYSAGHFNTVGSVEGFTPASFTSSRTDRAKTVAQDPSMFMDEEDVNAYGIAPDRLQTSTEYANEPGKRKRPFLAFGPIPGTPVLCDIVADPKLSVGYEILRSWGWREGQGVGPRLSWREKRRLRALKRAERKGRENAWSDQESGEEDALPQHIAEVTFAPDDDSAINLDEQLKQMHASFGLGYKPLSRDNILGPKKRDSLSDDVFRLATQCSDSKRGRTLAIKGQAFGVGAFEEEDEDIYSQEDMSQYDFTLGGSRTPLADLSSKPGHSKSVLGLCTVLEGFVLSSQPCTLKTLPPLPQLPNDYVPVQRCSRKKFSLLPHEVRGLGRQQLSHEDRRRLLDDSRTSVEIRYGLKGTAGDGALATVGGDGGGISEEQVPSSSGDALNLSSTSSSFSPGNKPFAWDPEKQKRYELYLRMKDKGLTGRYSETQPRSMTEWERNRESAEFERTAAIFKPLSAAMATRFVSANSGQTPLAAEAEPLLKEGLNMTVKRQPLLASPAAALQADKEAVSDVSIGRTSSVCLAPATDPRLAAARAAMFGKLTLLVQDWNPSNLLCKRFNVPPPRPKCDTVGVLSKESSKKGESIFSFLSHTPTAEENKRTISENSDKRFKSRWDHSQVHETQDVSSQNASTERQESTQTDEKETPEKYGLKVSVNGPPTMDLFKAIFMDTSSSDSESSDSERDETSPLKEDLQHTPASRSVRNTENASDKNDVASNSFDETETYSREHLKHVFVSKKKQLTADEKNSSSAHLNNEDNKQKRSMEKHVRSSGLSFDVESDENDHQDRSERLKRKPNSKRHLSELRSKAQTQKDSQEKTSNHTRPIAISKQANSTNELKSGASDGLSRDNSRPVMKQLAKRSPAGIFANIDFVELNKYRDFMDSAAELGQNSVHQEDQAIQTSLKCGVQKEVCSEEKVSKLRPRNDSESSDSQDAYGAALPPNFIDPLQVVRGSEEDLLSKKSKLQALQSVASDADEKYWKEKPSGSNSCTIKTHKKHKKEHKHRTSSDKKHKKQKKSKSHKKKKRRKSSSSSDSDESE